MAKLAKEATTVRRVLEPLFRKLDSGKYWSPEEGIACSILSEMQLLMESAGELCPFFSPFVFLFF